MRDSTVEDLTALLISREVDRRKLHADDIRVVLGTILEDGEKADAERYVHLRLQRWTEDQ